MPSIELSPSPYRRRPGSAMWMALAVCLLVGVCTRDAQAGWFDANWKYRRALDVAWDAEHANGSEVAVAEFYTSGHAQEDDSDVRVATDDGKLVECDVLEHGPGDMCRIAFALQKPQRRYYVYFGNAHPQTPAKPLEKPQFRSGLHVEMHASTGGRFDNYRDITQSFEHSADVLGKAYIDALFEGVNPIVDHGNTISRITGPLYAPQEGDYTFAISASERAGLWIDDQPIAFAHGAPGDTRFNGTAHLAHGRHELRVIYWSPGEFRISVGWKRPDMARFEPIGREYFGLLGHAQVGTLEEHNKTLTADFQATYAGECFYENHYSFRYHFTALYPKGLAAAPKTEWDFGDGQTATGAAVDHVYLSDGVYPLTVTARLGGNSDAQTTRFVVRRDPALITHPPADEPVTQSVIVARYDLAKAPTQWLPWVALLHSRAKAPAQALEAAKLLAREDASPNPAVAIAALQEVSDALESSGDLESAVALWDAVPERSPLKAKAVEHEGWLLLYGTADFDRAVRVMAPLAEHATGTLRIQYGQALVLAQHIDAGRKILTELLAVGHDNRQAAISGALARTIESYIRDGDWQTGEEQWRNWQERYPEEFLEGYGVLLETRLMELKKAPQAAARVCEAFARAVPESSYAPQMLDRASKLLATLDPARSKALRATLKEKYPEDPLSQGEP